MCSEQTAKGCRLKTLKKPDGILTGKSNEEKTCEVAECTRAHYAKGMCNMHWQRQAYREKLTRPVKQIRARGICAERNTLGQKHCHECDRWVSVDKFSAHNATKDKLQPICAECVNSKSKARAYHLTPVDIAQMLAAQKYKCCICAVDIRGARFIDHDHACCPDRNNTCGKCIRGLLCGACNLGLGAFRDDISRMRAAIKYLRRNQHKEK